MKKIILPFLIMILLAFYVFGAVTDGIVLNYHFDETSGSNATDSSVFDYDGIIDVTELGYSAKNSSFGTSFDFEKENSDTVQSVFHDEYNFGTGAFSFCYWSYSESAGAGGSDEQHHISYAFTGATQTGYLTKATSSTNIQLAILFGGSGNIINLDRDESLVESWTQICAIRYASNLTNCLMFDNRDQELCVQQPAQYNLDRLDEKVIIGARGDIQRFADGRIDEVVIWNRSIGNEEINAHYGGRIDFEIPCTPNLLNTTPTLYNLTACQNNDTVSQVYNWTQYDNNTCGGENTTFENFTFGVCNYCSYDAVNSTPTAYVNITTCDIDDTIIKNRNWSTYDQNLDSCFAVTNISTDLFNEGLNISYFQNATDDCDYCSFEVANISTGWINVSCLANDTRNQSNTTTQYDLNFDTCYAITSIESDLFVNISTSVYRYTEYCDGTIPLVVESEALLIPDVETLEGLVLIFIITFLYVCLLAMAFGFKNFGIMSLAFFIGLILGYMLSPIHIFLTFCLVLINIGLFMTASKTFK